MDLSRICVVSAGEFEGLTVYKKLPAQGDWDVFVFADSSCSPEDILACAENTLKTGHATVGHRGAVGFWNKITRLLYKFFAGLSLQDADAPVIALPKRPRQHFFKACWLLEIKREAMTLDQKQVSKTKECGLFSFMGAWFLILRHFIKYSLSAVFSAILEEGLLALFGRLFLGLLSGFAFNAATAGLARLISSLCNFFINKKLVFDSNTGTFKALLRYYAVAIPNGLLQIGLFHGACLLFGITESQTLVRGILHFGVMVLLFCVTFVIQQKWVFKKDC